MATHEGHWQCLAEKHALELLGACKVAEQDLARKAVTRADFVVVELVREAIRKAEVEEADGHIDDSLGL